MGEPAGICVNGVFGFPAFLHSLDPRVLDAHRDLLAGVTGTGESDCTLVFHTPQSPNPPPARNPMR